MSAATPCLALRVRCLRRSIKSLAPGPRHPISQCWRLNSTTTASSQGRLNIKPTASRSAPTASTPASAATPAAAPSAPASSSQPSSVDNAKTADLADGLNDFPVTFDDGGNQVDWARSFHGLSAQPFDKEAASILTAPIVVDDIEIKPDGIIYLPEIKYRRILNRAFGPGGWGLAPRGETIVTDKSVTREYALVAHGRSVLWSSS